MWGVAGAVYLLLVLWGPTHALRTPTGILVLGALAALGLYSLRRETLQEFPDAVHGDGPELAARVEALWSRRPRRSAHPRHETTDSPPRESAAAEIERLHALRAAGAITEEEFRRGKERALS